MAMLGPMESAPHIAVGCSGGGDSMALTLLVSNWVRRRKGQLTALIVDHRLRPESASEVRLVGRWLTERNIEFCILRRKNTPIVGDIQAKARAARYQLMTEWCRRNGVLHLALAHQREDQAETLLLRLARGSGLDGLAAMSVISEYPDLRLLRPLLDVPRDRLIATLARFKQPHIEDPSNLNLDFARVRMRQLSPTLTAEGMSAPRLAATAARLGRARDAMEKSVVAIIGHCVSPRTEGYCLVRAKPMLRAPEEIGLRILARVFACVSGAEHPPRMEQLERLYAWLKEGCVGSGRTLGGCRVSLWREHLLICREAAAVVDEAPLSKDIVWDRRFRLRTTIAPRQFADLSVRRLGSDGWRQVARSQPLLKHCLIPPAVRPTLPSIWSRSLDLVVAVPHLKYVNEAKGLMLDKVREISFVPVRRLCAPRFAFASSAFRAIL
jgi:tRNA(Ile)-lysidine synthase